MSLLQPLLLSFLPSTLTHLLLPHLSTYLPRFFPPAQRGSKSYDRNFKWGMTLLVGLYLGWSFVWGDTGGTGEGGGVGEEDWYGLLGVKRGVAEEELKRAFRTLSHTYHPDRARGAEAGAHFIRIRQAYEGLNDPVKRYAYDRFGPDILSWPCKSLREYMIFGLNQSSGFWVVSGAIMGGLALLGRAREGAFWRTLLFLFSLIIELQLLFTPSPSFYSKRNLTTLLCDTFLGPKPFFMQIRIVHRLCTLGSVGISQLAGVWAGKTEVGLEEVARMIKGLEVEIIAGFHDTVAPLLSTPNAVETQSRLKQGMEDVLYDRAISTHPQIRPIWIEALHRARAKTDRSARSNQYPPNDRYPDLSDLVGGRDSSGEEEVLYTAMGVPLPDSRPGSPVLGPRQL